jgi:hypothetical protein
MVSRHLCLLVLLQSACGFVTPDVACSRVDVKPRFRPVTLAASSPIVANAEADLQAAAPPPLPRAMPCGDPLDQRIWKLALPAFVNFLILPITGAVDLFFIGKLGSALATAGQAAANQVYSTAALLTNVVPIVTVPLIAKAHAAKDETEVQRQVGGGQCCVRSNPAATRRRLCHAHDSSRKCSRSHLPLVSAEQPRSAARWPRFDALAAPRRLERRAALQPALPALALAGRPP